MKSGLLGAAFAAAMSFVVSFGSASANTVTIFDVNATGGAVTGTLTVDVTAGTLNSADLVVPALSTSDFTNIISVVPFLFSGLKIQLTNADGFGFALGISPTPTLTSLIGMTGAGIGFAIFCNSSDCTSGGVSLYNGVNFLGTVDAEAATPLPAALPLFASGLGALGLLGWRRKRKASAIAA
jgi:hypothetical protein